MHIQFFLFRSLALEAGLFNFYIFYELYKQQFTAMSPN